MHSSVILKTMVQSACLKTAANITAQVVAQLRDAEPKPFDYQRVAEFCFFGFVQARIGCWWQQTLEDAFPTSPGAATANQQQQLPHDEMAAAKKQEDKDVNANASAKAPRPMTRRERLDYWGNIACKLVMDQTLGLVIMNTTFLVCTNAFRLWSVGLVVEVVREKLFQVIRAAWRLWPWVSIANFVWVPLEKRVLVAACFGFGWNMFLTFFAMAM